MPLNVLLLLVIGGIGAIVVLLHLLGKSGKLVMAPEDARAEWHGHFPDDMITDVLLAADGHSALIETEQGSGLLWAFGADTTGRRLRDFDIMDHKTGLRVLFHDYTAPTVTLHLTEIEKRVWRERMKPHD
ncbi:hypothetical protein ACXYMO_09270 [Arenibacterium sp. CAU 1754]